MQTFLIIGIGLMMLAGVFFAIPLWRRRQTLDDSDYQLSNIRLIKQRIAELEEEVTQGVMTEKHKEQAIKELKLALVDETNTQEKASVTQSAMLVWGSFLVLVGLSVGLYLNINSVDKLAHVYDVHQRMDELTQKIIMGEGGDITLQDVRDFSLAIRTRIDTENEDGTGWMLLGRLYASMQMFEEAYQAYDKSLAIAPDNMDTRENYAQALMMPNQLDYLRRARAQLEYILEREPQNNNAALMLALTASQLDDAETAELYLAQVSGLLPEDNPAVVQIRTKINELNARGAVQPTGFAIKINTTDMINRRLEADNQLTPMTMFVFARDTAGSRPLPVAVKKLNLTSLPSLVNLIHTDAMVANWSLKNVEEVELIVRLSYDDNVAPAPGEFTGSIVMPVRKEQIQAVTITVKEEIK